MCKISIIIATYNSGRTLRSALDSVRFQSYQDWECIIVDGESIDTTLSIIKEYADSDNRFRYISEHDNGIYDAYNKGWKMAGSEWILYLGSDDSLTHDGMSLIAAELDSKYAVVTGDVYLHRIDGTVRPMLNEGFFGCHQGVLMRRSVLEEMGGFDEKYKIVADYDLLVRTYMAGYEVKNVRFFLANFTVGGESQKISSQWKVMKEVYMIVKKNNFKNWPLMYALHNFVTISISHIYRIIKGTFKQ